MNLTVQAIDLIPGDEIIRWEGRPGINLYRGTVKNTVAVDQGVQVNYTDGGHVVSPEMTTVEIRR